MRVFRKPSFRQALGIGVLQGAFRASGLFVLFFFIFMYCFCRFLTGRRNYTTFSWIRGSGFGCIALSLLGAPSILAQLGRVTRWRRLISIFPTSK